MKKQTLRTAFALILLTAGFSRSYAQEANNMKTDPFTTQATKDAYELRSVNGVLKNGKVYLTWTATDATGECVYIIERSADGVNYQKLSAKKGAPSPGTASLMFSFTDDQPVQGRSYYRVQRAGTSGVAYTPAVMIDNAPVKQIDETTNGIASVK